MFQHILVPLDESPYAERALAQAEELARTYDGNLTLVVVVHAPQADDDDPIHRIQAERPKKAEAYLADRVADLRSRGFEAVTTEVRTGETADAIADAAREHAVDLISMSTHGLGNTGRYAVGSVALKVLMTAPCPVLMVRIQEAWNPAEH